MYVLFFLYYFQVQLRDIWISWQYLQLYIKGQLKVRREYKYLILRQVGNQIDRESYNVGEYIMDVELLFLV